MKPPMTLENLPLRDIHLPAEISWWPPAPGWWLLLLVSLLLFFSGYWFWRRRQRRHYRRLALLKIQEIEQDYLRHEDQRQLITELSRLLRQMALAHFPTDNCAGLVDDDWLAFLDQQTGKGAFSKGTGRVLARGPYLAQAPEVDVSDLLTACRMWLNSLPLAPRQVGGRDD